jgi:hypothetical protein
MAGAFLHLTNEDAITGTYEARDPWSQAWIKHAARWRCG